MKTKLRRISKRSLSMFLAILMMMSIMVVGTISASAALSVAGYIYFIKPSDWTYAALMIGHSSY